MEELLSALKNICNAKIILTGVGFDEKTTGIAVCDEKGISYYHHEKYGGGSHGTGDVYASAFTGAFVSGKSLFDAAKIAADFTVDCIKSTEPDHWYGVRFEKCIPKLIDMLK